MRLCGGQSCAVSDGFQSTHSLRSATRAPENVIRGEWFQSTHSLRSATIINGGQPLETIVSIHALLAECDLVSFGIVNVPCGFNPRTPCGVRPALADLDMINMWVSIHALLAECDTARASCPSSCSRFNPRTPCGVRPYVRAESRTVCEFQSTHSLRSATGAVDVHSPDYYVSIHALLAECDVQIVHIAKASIVFQSTHSLRSATKNNLTRYENLMFQSTHSLRSATSGRSASSPSCAVSIHALLAECDNPDNEKKH